MIKKNSIHTLCLFIFCFLFACQAKKNLPAVEGKLTNTSGETLYLEELSPEGVKTLDSAKVNEAGEFSFAYPIKHIGFYKVSVSQQIFAMLILDSNQTIKIKGDIRNLGNTYEVEGSPDSKLFLELNQKSQESYAKRDSLTKVFQNHLNSMSMDSVKLETISKDLENTYNQFTEQHNNYLVEFINNNITSLASIAAIQQLDPEKYFSSYEKLSESLSKKYANSPYVKLFVENTEKYRTLSMGAVAPDFTLNDPEGKPVSLSSFRGKIVLIDFWASWCGPCRAESPNLVQTYNKFKDKGFEIFSVALEKDKNKWLEAIEKDHLNWTHVSDLKFWNSEVVKLYNFNSIPTNYLIDREGKILAKNLRGDDIINKLCELEPAWCK